MSHVHPVRLALALALAIAPSVRIRTCPRLLERSCGDREHGDQGQLLRRGHPRLATSLLGAVTVESGGPGDTLGWVYFRQGDLGKAQKHIGAAWQLSQHAEAANHLGEIFERQGQREAAIHIWRLGLAANSKNESAREHLRKAGVPIFEPPKSKVALKDQPISPAEELGRLRTVKLSALPKQTGTAEFYLLASRSRVEDVAFIIGEARLSLRMKQFDMATMSSFSPMMVPRRLSVAVFSHARSTRSQAAI